MSDTLYEQAMGGITASEAFKAQLVAKMQEKAALAAQPAPTEAPKAASAAEDGPTAETTGKKQLPRAILLRRLTALAACLVVGFAAIYALRSLGTRLSDGYGSAAPAEDAAEAYNQDEAVMESPTADAAPMEPEAEMESGGLPALKVPDDASAGGMGFEGLMAYNADELVSGNPWSIDANLTHLPVYRNTAYREDFSRDGWPSDAERGITEESIDPPLALPAGYSFTHQGTTYPQAQDTLAWLAEKYAAGLGITEAAPNIYGGDYTFDGEGMGYTLGIYQGGGDLTQQILNYHFNRAEFYCDDDGKLFLIRRWQTDLSGYVGDYPIITADEAQNLLAESHYITTVPEEMPGEGYIAKVELVYRTGVYDELFMPYYRFLVEMPDMAQENGLKMYGAYYVPAVSGEHLSSMPLWDGQFN